MTNKKVSQYAHKILLSMKDVLYYDETLSHDGYNSYGLESNVYNLYIIQKNNTLYRYSVYHMEDWHHTKTEYYLMEERYYDSLDIKNI